MVAERTVSRTFSIEWAEQVRVGPVSRRSRRRGGKGDDEITHSTWTAASTPGTLAWHRG